MQSLFSRATAVDAINCTLPSGRAVTIRRLVVQFGDASPNRLPVGALPATYTSKPLVTFHGEAMFGELAVLRWLEVDGWEGVWLDTFHARKCWRAMPTRGSPVSLPVAMQARYDAIVAANGGRASGAFDVMAWRGAQVIFVEYKGPGDRANRNASRWMDAALDAGVSANDLLIVAGVARR